MFGIGGSEIIVILIVALLFLGPDKLPEATKLVSKGIRDLKKQQRLLQQTIENDEQIGGAIRDLKSALRGEDEVVRRPPVRKEPPKEQVEGSEEAAAETPTIMPPGHDAEGRLIEDGDAKPAITLPESAGEPDLDTANGKSEGDEDLVLGLGLDDHLLLDRRARGDLVAAQRALQIADRAADMLVILDRLLEDPRLLLEVANAIRDLLRGVRELVGPQEQERDNQDHEDLAASDAKHLQTIALSELAGGLPEVRR